MVFAIVIAVLVALDVVMGWMDARETDKGIKAGIGIEGNELITTIFHTDKPSLKQLCIFNAAQIGVFLAAGLALYHFIGHAMGGMLIAALLVDAAKHYQGFRQWAWMFRNPGKRVEDQERTAWQKFIGFWG